MKQYTIVRKLWDGSEESSHIYLPEGITLISGNAAEFKTYLGIIGEETAKIIDKLGNISVEIIKFTKDTYFIIINKVKFIKNTPEFYSSDQTCYENNVRRWNSYIAGYLYKHIIVVYDHNFCISQMIRIRKIYSVNRIIANIINIDDHNCNLATAELSLNDCFLNADITSPWGRIGIVRDDHKVYQYWEYMTYRICQSFRIPYDEYKPEEVDLDEAYKAFEKGDVEATAKLILGK